MKRIICAFLAAAVSLSALPSAFAKIDDSYKTQLEKVILSVKARLDISSEFDKFDSSVAGGYYGNSDKVYFNLNWQTSDKENYKYISVTADTDGNIASAYRHDSSWEQYGGELHLPKVSKTEALSKAKEYLAKIAPERAQKLEYIDGGSSVGDADSYSFQFQRIENGIPVKNDIAYLGLTLAGDNIYLSNYSINWTDKDFPASSALMDSAAADKAFRENGSLELRYRRQYYYYFRAGEQNAPIFLEYGYKDNYPAYIDAQTGKTVKEDSDGRIFYAGGQSIKAADVNVSSEYSLTEAEIAEIEKLKEVMSVSDMEKTVRKISEIGIKDTDSLLDCHVYKYGGEYKARLSFGTKSKDGKESTYSSFVEINAKTGELLSVNAYRVYQVDTTTQTEVKLTDEQMGAAEKKIVEFLTKYAPDKLKDAKKQELQSYDGVVSINYVRQIDGVPFYENTMSISWDTKSNTVVSMYMTWDKLPENLPKVANAISSDKAYDLLMNTYGLKLVYIISDKTPKAVYMVNTSDSVRINAVTGKLVDYSGAEYVDMSGNYTDIDGHWAEDIIKTLAENGIKTEGTAFRPDEAITQADYLRFLGTVNYSFSRDRKVSDDDVYDVMISQGIIDKSEKNPIAAVSREDAVAYLLRMMGFKKAAEIKGIYICDFSDAADIDESRVGYAAIAKGLGLVNGVDTMFMPKKETTRAEAAALIYNYLTR